MPITLETSFFSWKPTCWLRVQGADAFSFLQGQFSNDLRGLGRRKVEDDESLSAGGTSAGRLPFSQSVYGLWLDRKGRILGDGFVLRADEERFFICSYGSSGAALRAHLESFIVADEVEVSDETSEVVGLTLFLGEGEGTAVADFGKAGFMFEGHRGAEAIEWVGPALARDELLGQLNPRAELNAEEVERRRILAKVPAVPCDLGAGDLPQEGGPDFERVAVSYTKGCYLGQEVMSRLRTMGSVRRRLVSVRSKGLVPVELPVPLFFGEKRVGEIRSASAADAPCGFAGLALVSLYGLPTGSVRLSLYPRGPAEVTVEMPMP